MLRSGLSTDVPSNKGLTDLPEDAPDKYVVFKRTRGDHVAAAAVLLYKNNTIFSRALNSYMTSEGSSSNSLAAWMEVLEESLQITRRDMAGFSVMLLPWNDVKDLLKEFFIINPAPELNVDLLQEDQVRIVFPKRSNPDVAPRSLPGCVPRVYVCNSLEEEGDFDFPPNAIYSFYNDLAGFGIENNASQSKLAGLLFDPAKKARLGRFMSGFRDALFSCCKMIKLNRSIYRGISTTDKPPDSSNKNIQSYDANILNRSQNVFQSFTDVKTTASVFAKKTNSVVIQMDQSTDPQNPNFFYGIIVADVIDRSFNWGCYASERENILAPGTIYNFKESIYTPARMLRSELYTMHVSPTVDLSKLQDKLFVWKPEGDNPSRWREYSANDATVAPFKDNSNPPTRLSDFLTVY